MKTKLLIPFLLALVAAPSAAITDDADPVGIAVTVVELPAGAGTEIVLSITDGADPIPQLSGLSIASIDAVPESVSLTQDGTSVSVRIVVDHAADEGALQILLCFEGSEPLGFVLDLASITDGADPV